MLARERLAALAFGPLRLRRGKGREQPEIDVHRLEAARGAIASGAQMTAGDVIEQRAKRRGRRWRGDRLAKALGRRKAAGEQTDGGGLHIALDPGDLSREAEPRVCLEPETAIE